MLTISKDIFPQSCLSYIAFRAAFQETLERIALANQIGDDSAGCFGFLTEVPFLRAVPPHIQLDLLAETWKKHTANDSFDASLIDESIVYATCEVAARIVDSQPTDLQRYMKNGPLDVELAIDHHLSSELRALHLNLSNEGDFLLLSQFEDMTPEESTRLKKTFGLDELRLEPMFEVLGRWAVSRDFLNNLTGLLTGREIIRTVSVLGVQ
ncbi:hypothetical protein MNBD_PLANCTO02-1969 [hydrothermal vent metagenome]|uniref:Uncharacterized protein n=1 Tax=hydrothermal vent metagenome TaxID=652676 RepID=A0A3B1E264_9ZZZZ